MNGAVNIALNLKLTLHCKQRRSDGYYCWRADRAVARFGNRLPASLIYQQC